MLANILCQHTPLTPGVRSKDHFFFSEITPWVGATRIQPRKNCDHYLHFTVAVLGKFDILFFHWNAQVSVKVSMISVLSKIKDVLGVIFVQKMCESWLKNNILFLIITYFNLKLINMYIFCIHCRISIFQRQKGKIKLLVDILCVFNNFYLISEKRSICLKG